MRNGRLHCGVDIGTTNIKAVLLDENGWSVATRSAPTPRIDDGEGVASDALMIVSKVEELISAAFRDANAMHPLASIAVTGIGEDGVGVDAELRPTGLVIPWFDNRAAAEAHEFDPGLAVSAGIGVDPARTAAKWLWLRNNRREELALARVWLALTDLPAVLWTGNVFMSETLAVRTACYDIYRRQWIEEALEQAGAPPLPPILTAGAPVGTVQSGALRSAGVADGTTVVAAGGHDHPVASWAIRNQFEGARVDSMGTANLLYAETSRMAAPRIDPYLAFSVPVDGGARISCLGVFEFAAELASVTGLAETLAAPRLPGLPTSTGHLFETARDSRATLDACGLYARRMLDAAMEAGSARGPICATGGWSRSAALMEQRASIYGEAVRVVQEPELTAVAAGMLGAAASGKTLPLGAAMKAVEIEPLSDWQEPYGEIYASYRPLIDARMKAASAQLPSIPHITGA